MFDFSGRVVLVTGSGHGLGQGIARRFAQAGASIAIHYRSSQEGALVLAGELMELGVQAQVFQASLDREGEASRLVDVVINHFGRLDVLINNAGTYPARPLIEMSLNEWNEVIESNLRSLFLCTQVAAKAMIVAGEGGAIINIASIEALSPGNEHSHYSTVKAGVLMHTRAAARELGQYGIRVNAVSPGLISRPGIEQDWPQGVQSWLEAAALPRLGWPEDVADACLFLASPASRWITGINLVVDGGASTRPVF